MRDDTQESSIRIRPLTVDLLADHAALFESNATTRGCQCLYFRLLRSEFNAGWSGGNREIFERFARSEDPPSGLLAYRDDEPVGWCAVGPRSRYPRTLSKRAVILRGRDPGEDDDVWLVTCFFVRVGARRAGITHRLLQAAVDAAERAGATAIEGFPLAGSGPHKADKYLGSEPLFVACGFDCVARPTPSRVVMRRDLR